MPTKSLNNTKKSGSKSLKDLNNTSKSKKLYKKVEEKKDKKKIVIKRRKVDLVPTKASAVAIVSRANRAKKQALIKKVSTSVNIPTEDNRHSSESKIPTWIWIFFWCSLLLFCVSFYWAIIHPQMKGENNNIQNIEWVNWDVEIEDVQSEENDDLILSDENLDENIVEDEESQIESQYVQRTAENTITEFFNRLSDRDFDWAFDLMIPALKGYTDIKTHFTSFRMDPFLDWVEWWKLVPENIKYIKSPSYWKDIYNFDLSYVMESNQEKYEEVWEFGINTSWDEPRISSIRCISSKCSYHPIFWPENFGLMR